MGALISSAGPVLAGSESPAPVDLIVVTATRTERELGDTTIPTQVIEREDILRTSARSIEEVLDRIPGIFVRTNEPFRMGASTVRMQGADSNKVAILLDGRRFRGGVDGVVDVRDIPVANIQRIEVVRGPASSLYGSDAMGGVINIITRGGTEEPSLDVTAGAGSFDGLLLSASHGYRVGDLSYFISAQHSESQVARELGAFSSQFDGEAGDAIQSRTDIFLDVDYALAEAHELSFIGDVNPVREGPQSERFNMSLTGDWRWTPSDDTAVRLGVSRYSFDRDNDLPGFQEDVSYVDWTFDVIGSHSFAGLFDEAHTASVGFVHRRQAIDSRGIERMFADGTSFTPPSVEEAVYTNSPFLQDEIELWAGVSAVLGLSIDKHSEFDAQANPRVALSWNPLASVRLAALYGRGYRAPDLLQLYDSDFNNVIGIGADGMPLGYAIIGNPDLEPETDNAWNLQLDFDPHPAVSGFLTLFRHDFRDLITTALCDDECRAGYAGVLPTLVFTNENIDRATTQGLELGVTLRPLELFDRGLNHSLDIDLGYAFLDSEDRSGRENDGNELPFRPPHRFLPGVTYEYDPWQSGLRIWGEWEDRSYSDVTNTSVIPSHWIWSFKATAEVGGLVRRWLHDGVDPPGRIELFVEGLNLFDETYGVPGPMGRAVGRRSFLAGAAYRL